MAKIKVGVIGVGVMGEHHARIYSTLKEAKLVGVFDPDLDRSGLIASKYGCVSFSALEALLKEVDAVSLASPTSLHYELALACLNKNVHLLAEKPLAASSIQAEEIVALAGKKKLVLAVGMIERFNPAFKKAQALVRHETILGMDFKRFSPFPARISDASVVFDMMLHDIDLCLALSKTTVASIKASGRKVKSDKLDECSAIFYFKDGLISKIEASRIKTDKKRSIVITAESALYEVDLLGKRLFKRDFNHLTEKQSIETQNEDQLTLELKDFLHAIGRDREPKVPGNEAVSAIKLAEEVERLSCL